jgi:hypothetical protein
LKTACPSCGSEEVLKSNVYFHGCGALIPEEAVGGLFPALSAAVI